MGRRGLALLACSALLGLAHPGLAGADETHFQRYVLGDRAMGMGGAYTGVADDPSAAFYNPGGLGFVPSNSLSASLSINAAGRRVIEDGYGSAVGTANLRSSGWNALPLFTSVVKRFGPRSDGDLRRFALAVSTFFPMNYSYSYEVALRNESLRVRDALQIDREDRTTYFGPTFAARISDEWAVGMSLFLSNRRMSHREDQTTVTEGVLNEDRGTYENATLSVRETLARIRARHIVMRLGALYRPSPRLQFGLTFQPPGIPIGASARIRHRQPFADLLADPGYATLFDDEQRGLDAESPIPWGLRLGMAFRPSDAILLSMDCSLHGRSGSASDPVIPIETPEPDPETGVPPSAGLFFPAQWHRRLTANIAIGSEFIVADRVPLRFGFLTNFSAAPELEAESDTPALEHLDLFGATASVGYRTEEYDVQVGVAAQWGSGQAQALNPNPNGATYIATEMREWNVQIFFSGHKQAASRLARTAMRRIRERGREDDSDSGDSGDDSDNNDADDANGGVDDASDAMGDAPGEDPQQP